MKIDKPGKCRLLSKMITRNAVAGGILPKGTILDIIQIDFNCHKVIGNPLMDWHYWEIDAELLKEGEQK